MQAPEKASSNPVRTRAPVFRPLTGNCWAFDVVSGRTVVAGRPGAAAMVLAVLGTMGVTTEAEVATGGGDVGVEDTVVVS